MNASIPLITLEEETYGIVPEMWSARLSRFPRLILGNISVKKKDFHKIGLFTPPDGFFAFENEMLVFPYEIFLAFFHIGFHEGVIGRITLIYWNKKFLA